MDCLQSQHADQYNARVVSGEIATTHTAVIRDRRELVIQGYRHLFTVSQVMQANYQLVSYETAHCTCPLA